MNHHEANNRIFCFMMKVWTKLPKVSDYQFRFVGNLLNIWNDFEFLINVALKLYKGEGFATISQADHR